MKNAPKMHAVKTPDLLTSLSAEEVRLILDCRGMRNVDRNCITMFAAALFRKTPRPTALRLVKGGA